ncbi:MAG TPA: ABC transporter permease [Blastocatellia bacterium]|jgi:putative ABC transport system permease protein|nr:ABC transporter permease [Blastocatellia bacterium]
MQSLWQDLRFGARMLIKKPGFTLIGVLTLALGIGANTAIFSVVNAVLLQSLPYAKADELVEIYRTPGGEETWPFPPAAYLNLKSRNTVFTDIAALDNRGLPATMTGLGEPERLQGYKVSANFFTLLGVAMRQGRTFLPEEDRPAANRVVVISHEFWLRRFGGDTQLIGQSINLNGDSYTVIGVTPAGYRFGAKADLWTPLALTAADENERGSSYLNLIGRRKPGVTFERAGAEVETIRREFDNNPNSEVRARISLPQESLTKEVRPMLLLLVAAVGFVLLIACVNTANLLLARASVRSRELAIRAALGAGRLRVIRQLLAESAMLALAGGALGLLLASWGVEFLASGLPEYLANANARVAMLKIDAMALGFTFALSMLTSFLFGLIPALRLSKVDLNEALKEGARTAGARSRLRQALVIVEIALAMVVLVGGGLTIKSFWRLAHVDLGYEPEGVLTAQIDPSGARYKEFEQVTSFYQGLLGRISAIPGTRYAGFINSVNSSTNFGIDEHPPLPPEKEPMAQQNQVSADYFKAMGIPLRAGRFFNEHDVKGAQPVAIIDETLARREFPGENPVGKHITFWRTSREIVGVVGAAKYWSLTGEPASHIYLSYLQDNWWSMSLRVRAQSGDPMNLATPIRAELATIDKNQPIHSFKPLEAQVSELIAPQRFTTALMAGFAALAALLAAIGIYGVMSYTVAERTREIGVRIALGARTGNVMRMVLRHGMALAIVGVMIGLAAAFALTRMISGLLFGVQATDPATLMAITLLLLAVALVSCLIPARRATKVDPLVALRHE